MSTTSTDPGDRSPSDIERDVDQERARVAGTIDALQDRFSASNIVDEVMRSVSQNGGEITRNLGRTIRDNPLPMILTGVGLAWLMAGSSRSDRGYDRYDDDWDDGMAERSRLSSYPVSDYPDDGYGDETLADPTFGASSTPYAGGLGDTDRPVGDYGTAPPKPGSDGPSLGDRARAMGDAVGQRATGMSDAARDRAGRARDGLSAAGGRAREGMQSASDSVRGAADDARRRTRAGGEAVRESFETLLEDQPLVVGALALAVGAAFGGLLPRTQTEDEWMGEQSDRLKDDVVSSVQENADKAKAVGMAVADEAMNMADEAAGELDDRSPKGSDLASSAESAVTAAAERLRKRGEDEADKQGLTSKKTST